MAKSKNFYLLVVLILASYAIPSFANLELAIASAAKSPSSEPIVGIIKFLAQCEKRITHKCANEILNSIFHSDTVTKQCCVELVAMGKTCHDELVKYMAHGPHFEAHLLEYLAKGEKIYENCNSIVLSPSS